MVFLGQQTSLHWTSLSELRPSAASPTKFSTWKEAAAVDLISIWRHLCANQLEVFGLLEVTLHPLNWVGLTNHFRVLGT